MEESTGKKDQTPYIVFACKKCKRYLYVKTTQKTKKCLACGRTHQVKEITGGIIVNGMTMALNTVKKKQHELAVKELGHAPDFKGENDFMVFQEPSEIQRLPKEVADYEGFQQFIRRLSREYREFPLYVIEMLAEEKRIDRSELHSYLGIALKKEFLQLKDKLYSLK